MEPSTFLTLASGGNTDDANDPVKQEWITFLDRALHEHWDLGRNLIMAWTPTRNSLRILVVPHYTIAEHAKIARIEAEENKGKLFADNTKSLIEEIIANPKHVTGEGLDYLAASMEIESREIELPFEPGYDLTYETLELIISRYSMSYIEDRAVALFDIVGFSLLSPLEQVTQLNSLSNSMFQAHSKMMDKEIDVNFTRSTTGDGFYLWNRDRSIQANVNLYHFMHLILADNAIAHSKSNANTSPVLRAGFHIGGHYEFYQSEGLNPTVYSYIVGEVTIELARIVDRAVPGQVLVGDFHVPMPDTESKSIKRIDTVKFIEQTQMALSSLTGVVLAGDEVEEIQCYLTGQKREETNDFAIKKYLLADKHGMTRNVYNAKINIYRKDAEPIFLGIQESDLGDFKFTSTSFA